MKLKAWILLILCNLFWSGNMIIGKLVTSQLPTVWMITIRWLIAFLFLWPLAHLTEHPNWWKLFKENILILLFMSVVGIVLYNWVTYTALNYTTSLNASLINALNPGVIILFSSILLHVRMKTGQIIGLVFSFFGVLLVITKGQPWLAFQMHYNNGDALMLVVIIMWTIYSIVGRSAQNIPPITLIAMTSFIGFVITLPFLPFFPVHLADLNVQVVLGMIFIGIFPSFLSFVMWNIGIRLLGPSIAGLSMNLICVYTAIISALLGEQLLISQIVGGLIIIFGIVLSSGTPLFHRKTMFKEKNLLKK
ncbi:MAG: DMT family transporter [Sporolactobacillus sp.]